MAANVASEVLFTLIKTQVFTGDNLTSLPLNDVRALHASILRIPANGAALKVYVKDQEVGTVESTLAAALTCLMDSRVCRIVGSFEFSPLQRNHLTCNISLFATQQMIPVAVAILKLKGITVVPAGQAAPTPIVMSNQPALVNSDGRIVSGISPQSITPSVSGQAATHKTPNSSTHCTSAATSTASTPGIADAIPSMAPVHVNKIVTLEIRGNGGPHKLPSNVGTTKLPGNQVAAKIPGNHVTAKVPGKLAVTSRVPFSDLSNVAPRNSLVKAPVIRHTGNAVMPMTVPCSTLGNSTISSLESRVPGSQTSTHSPDLIYNLDDVPGPGISTGLGSINTFVQNPIPSSASATTSIQPSFPGKDSVPGILYGTNANNTSSEGLLQSQQPLLKNGTKDVLVIETQPGSFNSKMKTIPVQSITDSIVNKFMTTLTSKPVDSPQPNSAVDDRSKTVCTSGDNNNMATSASKDIAQDTAAMGCDDSAMMDTGNSSFDEKPASQGGGFSDGDIPEMKPVVKLEPKSDSSKGNDESKKCPPFCNCSQCVAKAVPGPSNAPGGHPMLTMLSSSIADNDSDDDDDASNVQLPPVAIGDCLLCGGPSCMHSSRRSTGDDGDDIKPFLPPPMQAMSELDKLFETLGEYDKEGIYEPASVILTEMFPHQKQALNWMIAKERNQDLAPFWEKVSNRSWFNKGTKLSTDVCPYGIKGGILADDMGLGKTLTVIALIVTNHINGVPMFSKRESAARKRGAPKSPSDNNDKSPETEPPPKKQHVESSSDDCEIIEITEVKTETKRDIKRETMAKKRRDEINNKKRLTNHKVLKQPGFSFRQMFLPKFVQRQERKAKKDSKAGIKKEKTESSSPATPKPAAPSTPAPATPVPRPITIIDDDSDTPSSQPTNTPQPACEPGRLTIKQYTPNAIPFNAARATLIVCPLSVLSNWTDQICTHVHPSVELRVYMYYGGERIKDVQYLSRQDIILTTYPTIGSDFRMKDSPLHKIKWLRIVLDEGHTIRNATTTWTKAILLLKSQRKWALSGTPIQNRIDDLWSIIRFIELDPFNDPVWWKRSIANHIRRGDEQAQERLQTLIKHISIRRLKTDKTSADEPLVDLPPRHVVIQDITLSDEERKIYDTLQHKGTLIIKGYLRHGTVLKNYAHCFAILMRLRQLCLHPDLVKSALDALDAFAEDSDDDDDDLDHDMSTEHLIKQLLQVLSSGVSEECAICLESLEDPVITRCAHVYCQGCIKDVLESEGLEPRCPMCRAPVNQNDLVKVPEERLREVEPPKASEADGSAPAELKPSAKITALMGALDAIRDKDPSVKSIIVSQFTSFLNILQTFLDREGFETLRLDGTMTQEARCEVIDRFRDPNSPKIFLLSLTAGGVGLNLTAATRVFLMDPAWNPATEEQCFDRCHRLGQTKEVIVTKYIVMDSVEERMLTLQDQKRELMTAAFGLKAQSVEDRRRARVRDITHLIGIGTRP